MDADAGSSRAPTLLDVYEARRRIRPYLQKTPLFQYPGLSEAAGCAVYVKHENHHPIGSFKIRGGINLVSQLAPEEKARGVVTASTGNHGQSVAYAARLFGVKARVCVPVGANPDKVAAIRGFGAEIVEHGRDLDEAIAHARALASGEGLRFIHTGNEPRLVAGVATMALEIIEDEPDLDAIYVPAGTGTLASGVSIVYRALSPATRVVAVQAESAPALARSWRTGVREVVPAKPTLADGLASRETYDLPYGILREKADLVTTVTEEEIRGAIRLYLEKTHSLTEGAGAAALAAAVKHREENHGKRVAVVLSGGNITAAALRSVLSNDA